MSQPKQSPVRKSLNDVKVKYSPAKKQSNKYNNVFVRGYKFGLMTLEFKKFSDQNEDAYYKDFLDLLDTDPKVGNDLGIIKVAFVRDSSKCSIAKIQSSGYKARHFLGIAPQERENDNEYRKKWADKIIAITLHHLQQNFNGFGTIITFILWTIEIIGFINKQNTTHRFFEHLSGLGCRMSDILADKVIAGRRHHMALTQIAKSVQNLGHPSGHGGFTCARRSGK